MNHPDRDHSRLSETSDDQYRKNGLSLIGAVAMGTGVMIGAGVFALTGQYPVFERSPHPGLDGVWGAEDDDYGDLRLWLYSWAIDAGDTALLPADEFDLDGDGDVTELLPIDFDGRPRVYGTTVDIGAYEFVPSVPGDFDGDGSVSTQDIGPFVRAMTDPSGFATERPYVDLMAIDPNGDGVIDTQDINAFVDLLTGSGSATQFVSSASEGGSRVTARQLLGQDDAEDVLSAWSAGVS